MSTLADFANLPQTGFLQVTDLGSIRVILGLYRGYIRGVLGLYRGYIGIIEKKMETTI